MCVKTIAPELFAEDGPETGNFTRRREGAEGEKQSPFCFLNLYFSASPHLRVTTSFPLNFGVQKCAGEAGVPRG